MIESGPFIPFYTSDFLGGTGGMTAAQKGVYITLLCLMYEEEGSISTPYDMLARRCGCTLPSFKKTLATLCAIGKIQVLEDGLWSDKCDRHITQRREKRTSAKAAAEKRWEKGQQKQGPSDADAMPAQCYPEPEPDISTNVDIKGASVSDDLTCAVDAWNATAAKHGLSQVQKLTRARKSKLKARLNDCGGIDGWRDAVGKVTESDFLLGKQGDWKANFDFMLREGNFTKLMEDGYAGTTNGGKRAALDLESQARQRREAIADAIRPEFDEGAGMADDSDGTTGQHGDSEGAGGHAALIDGPDSGPGGQDCSSGTEGMGGGDGPAVDVRSGVQPADGGPENGGEHVPRRTSGPAAGLVTRSDQPHDCGASLSYATETGRHSGQGSGGVDDDEGGLESGATPSELVMI